MLCLCTRRRLTAFRPATATLLPPTAPTIRRYGDSISSSSSSSSGGGGIGAGPDSHATRKPHELDVQSHSSRQGMRERDAAEGGGGSGEYKQNPKRDHPKAPEPVIGMQDERGHTSRSQNYLRASSASRD